MSRSDETNAVTDGGAVSADEPSDVESLLDATADVEITRKDEYRRLVDEKILAPVRIVRSDWRALVGSAIIVLYLLAGLVAWVSASDFWLLQHVTIVPEPRMNETMRYLGPFQDWRYPLGADSMGTGIFRQLVHATPEILQMVFAGAVFSTVIATIVGTFSGYKSGRIDRVLMSLTDVMLTIPGLPLIIVIATILEPQNPFVVGIVLTINAWAGLARAIRSQVLTLREESYVEASRTMGLRTRTILSDDIIPNLMPYISVNFVNSARGVIFSAVGLYFLGILPFQDISNWGVMMNMAYDTGGALYTWTAFHWILWPMLTVVLFSLGLILFAQALDRIFNPRVRARHAKSIDDEDGQRDESSTSTSVNQHV